MRYAALCCAVFGGISLRIGRKRQQKRKSRPVTVRHSFYLLQINMTQTKNKKTFGTSPTLVQQQSHHFDCLLWAGLIQAAGPLELASLLFMGKLIILSKLMQSEYD